MVKPAIGESVDLLWHALASCLAEALDLNDVRATWVMENRVPEMAVRRNRSDNRSELSVGRVVLSRAPATQAASERVLPVSRNFAATKESLKLMEQISAAIQLNEAVLLVGETGTGKTTVVQHVASLLSRPFTALNLSQQSEASDLLGGFKPVEAKMPAMELHNDWVQLFTSTFSSKRNAKFLEAERKAMSSGKWSKVCGLWEDSAKMAAAHQAASTAAEGDIRKRQKTGPGSEKRVASRNPSPEDDSASQWSAFLDRVKLFRQQHVQEASSARRRFNFAFVEGPLVRAIRKGEWILLDEINLAADETLDFLSALLQSATSSITLTERGDLQAITRHPDFRLFACMNPATDVGKKSLPLSIRSRFTELYVSSPDANREALRVIVDKYIGEIAQGDKTVVEDVVEAYTATKILAQQGELADGANQRPHFSIRTLSRALSSAHQLVSSFGLRRSLYESFLLCFTMGLDISSVLKLIDIITQQFIATARNAKQIMTVIPKAPAGGEHVQFGHFWLRTGPLVPEHSPSYILTPSVHAKLLSLARAIAIGRFPVLIQGPTSAGKTSAIEYLAKRTGHRFVRINNHEHTDLQEYMGSYISDPHTGQLRFQEGLLVTALRRGDWIVLDELNLAPTDVLEALNRLLDDNRELFVAETGETIRPHPHFMLFATQNPPGLYGGRKVLSRAFRNRFLEAHFDDVPSNELEMILAQRCQIAPSYASKIVAVFGELQRRRQVDRVFEAKQSFATLRDLFRWGLREAIGHEQLAETGYMLLGERARREEDRRTVKEVIEQVLRVTIDTESMYDLSSEANALRRHLGSDFNEKVLKQIRSSGLVPTRSLQRLISLQCLAFAYREPVLLVGEPGTGKTAVCDVVAKAFETRLEVVNCHQNTDASDLLGGQRPLRNRSAMEATALQLAAVCAGHNFDTIHDAALWLHHAISQKQVPRELDFYSALRAVQAAGALFEWYDGPLVLAMNHGEHMLLDEISLADDSVLERLNSVLESGRILTLPNRQSTTSAAVHEKGTEGSAQSHEVKAVEEFQVSATMNPGGDYGKKELDRSDLSAIITAALVDVSQDWIVDAMLDFTSWLSDQLSLPLSSLVTLRDFLAWAAFIRSTVAHPLHDQRPLIIGEAFDEGARLSIVEALSTLPILGPFSPDRVAYTKKLAKRWLVARVQVHEKSYHPLLIKEPILDEHSFKIGPYMLPRLPTAASQTAAFAFSASTTLRNAYNILRALQVPSKSILLEGSPGAGKTSLVNALSQISGHQLVRINLSEQTEIADLFGSELPVEGERVGEFDWRDAAFLTALKDGAW
jgi:midasin